MLKDHDAILLKFEEKCDAWLQIKFPGKLSIELEAWKKDVQTHDDSDSSSPTYPFLESYFKISSSNLRR